ncbi:MULTISPECIES: glycosyltransferase family 4 protein [Flavobacteriaceae]|uniref:glycosyltransferase family 4 protein n=1 Tax=Flavobacteriaceae TaxID=49546 RepID=UPI00103902F5|nr:MULTISPECIES: glycosyltransferase family 4 protein [Flavobacteriaceae]TBV26708.1 glycosyltransferase family 1 protein [Meridianimaribacter sp. CL38]
MKKIIRVTTMPGSINSLLKGQLGFMSQHYNILAVSSDEGGRLKSIGEEEGIPTYAVEMTRKITPIRDLAATYSLYKLFKKEKPFIVHTHTPKAGIAGMLAAKLAKVPHRLHTVAGLPLLESKGLKRKLLDIVEKSTYNCSSLVLPNSFGLKQIIIDLKFANQSKLKVIGNGSSNGINVEHFNPEAISESQKEKLRLKFGIQPNDFVFIFVGRIVGDKGINELIKAFNSLNKEYSTIKLLLLGHKESHLDPISKKSLKVLKENKNIIELGFQTDIRPYLSISNVLTFPSYREGFPNAVLQACAMQVPCIASNINGCNEIIKNEINGIIIPPKDTKSLKNAMAFCLNNPQKVKEMSRVSRNTITDLYSQDIVWKELLSLYKTLEE